MHTHTHAKHANTQNGFFKRANKRRQQTQETLGRERWARGSRCDVKKQGGKELQRNYTAPAANKHKKKITRSAFLFENKDESGQRDKKKATL